jgi:hypothetical protein
MTESNTSIDFAEEVSQMFNNILFQLAELKKDQTTILDEKDAVINDVINNHNNMVELVETLVSRVSALEKTIKLK